MFPFFKIIQKKCTIIFPLASNQNKNAMDNVKARQDSSLDTKPSHWLLHQFNKPLLSDAITS